MASRSSRSETIGLCKESLLDQLAKLQQWFENYSKEEKSIFEIPQEDRINECEVKSQNYCCYKERIEDIKEALHKIEQKDGFGVCCDCQKPINEERLIIFPFAKRCVSCQKKKEARPF